jgi:hypothetical protein
MRKVFGVLVVLLAGVTANAADQLYVLTVPSSPQPVYFVLPETAVSVKTEVKEAKKETAKVTKIYELVLARRPLLPSLRRPQQQYLVIESSK